MKMKQSAKAKGKGMKGPMPKMPSPGKMMKGEPAEKMMADKMPMMGKSKERM
jgi:hypothetical protein